MNKDLSVTDFVEAKVNNSVKSFYVPKWLRSETTVLVVLLVLTILTWLPRLNGPLDLRWDGGVYYILGTSLAEGRGYRLLNEPGEIDAVQYPPLLPLIVAGYQLILGTNDFTTVGRWLRFSAFISFIIFIYVAFRFFKNYLSLPYAFLATILCLFTLHVYFLSDLLFPEILFSLATLLFILSSQKEQNRTHSGLTYLFAVLSYALRTIGLAAFAAWVLESILKKRFKQAALRALLVLIPIVCWQFYIASIESSFAYNNPAYAYQRAPYLFYNVSYARNVSLVAPFAPEKGATSPIKIVRRFVHNAVNLPVNLGETLTTSKGYWEMWLGALFNNTVLSLIISWSVFLLLYSIGLFVFGGLILQLLRRQWIIPLYLSLYLAALCLTPFPEQYLRYLMPVVPLLVLSLIIFLLALKNQSRRFLSVRTTGFGTYLVIATLSMTLLTKLITFALVYAQGHQQISYIDHNNQPVNYRLFFYDKSEQNYDLAIDYVKQQAQPDDIIAAGTPHWVYLRTKLKAVMPPLEQDVFKAQQLLDSVPVSYLIVGNDVIGAERYTLPVVRQFADQWKQVYSAPEGDWVVYQRVKR